MIETLLIIVVTVFALCSWRLGRAACGYLPFIRSIQATGPGRQVTLDLYIATAIPCIWMVHDALEVGISLARVAPYILVAVFIASFGPLLYLLHRLVVL